MQARISKALGSPGLEGNGNARWPSWRLLIKHIYKLLRKQTATQ